MQPRDLKLAELKTTYVESARNQYDSLFSTLQMKLEQDYLQHQLKPLIMSIIECLPPELVSLALEYMVSELYYASMTCRLVWGGSSLMHAKDATHFSVGYYLEGVDAVRKTIESQLPRASFDSYSDKNKQSIAETIEQQRNFTNNGRSSYVYIAYSKVKGNQEDVLVSIRGYQFGSHTIVLSSPIEIQFVPDMKSDRYRYRSGPEMKVESVSGAFADAVCVVPERIDHTGGFDRPPLPSGAPYEYYLGDEKKRENVTQLLLERNRLFACKTTVNPPHKPLRDFKFFSMPVSVSRAHTNAMQRYLNEVKDAHKFSEHKLTVSERLEFRNLNVALQDVHTGQIPDVPVRLLDKLYDLKTLQDIKPDAQGRRVIPSAAGAIAQTFGLADIQPAKDIFDKIQQKIKLELDVRDDVVPAAPGGPK